MQADKRKIMCVKSSSRKNLDYYRDIWRWI